MARMPPARPLAPPLRSPLRASRTLLLAALWLAWGAGSAAGDGTPGLDASRRAEIERQVGGAVEAFRAAQVARDAGAVLDHFWPEFHMLLDGSRTSYAEIAPLIEQTMASLAALESDWSDRRIEAVGEHLALASFLFSDAMTLESGEVVRLRGETTLLWERRGGAWRIRYADSDHYPPPAD